MEIIENRGDRFLRLRDVMDTTILCRSSIYSLIKAGEVPKNFTVMGKRKASVRERISMRI